MIILAVNPCVAGSSPALPSFMVFLAEWFRRRIVVPVYVGSNPTEHPMILGYGVMVTRQILVLSFQVRVLIAQQFSRSSSVVEQESRLKSLQDCKLTATIV